MSGAVSMQKQHTLAPMQPIMIGFVARINGACGELGAFDRAHSRTSQYLIKVEIQKSGWCNMLYMEYNFDVFWSLVFLKGASWIQVSLG